MLIPIGRFARATRLSVKSLRRYDESGLLPAAFVDPYSGYRYYRIEQLARAETIRFLRTAEMPLADIEIVLEGDDPEAALTAHLATLERRRDDIDRWTDQLRSRIDRKDHVMSHNVVIKPTPAVTAAAYRTETRYPGIFDDIPAGFGRVLDELSTAGVDPTGLPFTVYHRVTDADTAGDIAMCVPVPASFRPAEPVALVEIPAGAAATVVHRGGYDDLSASYAAVATWIHERGHRITGPHREVYLNSPADTSEDELLTEIVFPVDAEYDERPLSGE